MTLELRELKAKGKDERKEVKVGEGCWERGGIEMNARERKRERKRERDRETERARERERASAVLAWITLTWMDV